VNTRSINKTKTPGPEELDKMQIEAEAEQYEHVDGDD